MVLLSFLASKSSRLRLYRAQCRNWTGLLATEEAAKTALQSENAALLKSKVDAETSLDQFKQADLEASKSSLAKAQAASKMNYNKGLDWKEHAGRRGDFIADVLSKLGDSFTDEQRIQFVHCAREHKVNLNSLKEKSAQKRKSAQSKVAKTADVSGSELKAQSGQGSGELELSDASTLPRM